MVHNVLVQLRNKKNTAEITDAFQIVSSESINFLNKYLNQINSSTQDYIFFYGSLRLIDTLEEILSIRDASPEEVLVIDYMSIEDQDVKWRVEFDDTIVSLAVCGEHVLATTYYGKAYQIRKDGSEKRALEFNCNGFSGDYGYFDNRVFFSASGDNSMIFDSPIKELSAFGNDYAIAIENKILLVEGEVKKEILVNEIYRSIILTRDYIYWIESLNMICRYDRKASKINHYSSANTIIRIAEKDGVIYGTTSDSKVIVVKEEKVECYPIAERMCKNIVTSDLELVALLSHHKVLLLDRCDGFALKKEILLKEQANSFVFVDDTLYIAHGNLLSSFSASFV